MSESMAIVPYEGIERRILLLRGHKVILDRDLSELYGVTLRFHFGILEKGAHAKYLPHAFTEQGVAMLSSVLRSERAVLVNIEIMRAFVRLKRVLATHAGLARKLTAMEKKVDAQFKVVFDALRALMRAPEKKKRPIGFAAKEAKGRYRK